MKAAGLKVRRRAAGLGQLTQVAAMPYRRRDDLEILLVTSRETARWVIPKGWPMTGKTPRESAACEAFEEAGVAGAMGDAALGEYNYIKFIKNGEGLPCRVTVFALAVEQESDSWPEQHQRSLCWFPWLLAADAVHEPGLKAIIRDFAEQLGSAKPVAA